MPNQPPPPTAPATPQNNGAAHPRTAALWMWIMVAGTGVAAFMADRDSRNRSQIERAVERTAVGDRVFFPTEGGPSLLFEGKPLVLAGAPESRPESAMLLVGTAEGLPYKLYAPSERVDSNGTVGGPTWWVKTGPGLFLKASQ